MSGAGVYLDGHSARPKRVTVDPGADSLRIIGPDGEILAVWDNASVRRIEGPGDVLRLRQAVDGGARLEVVDREFARRLREVCPDLEHREAIDGRRRRHIVVWALAACVSIVPVAIYGVPMVAERLVPFIPPTVEARIGAAAKRNLVAVLAEKRTCDPAPAARRALATLVDRLAGNGQEPGVPVDVTLVPSPMANALALPGSHVLVLTGLLKHTRTVDEFAAVLAHEMGHVAYRHPMSKLASDAGFYFLLGMVLGDFGGSTVILGVSRAMLSAGFSRDAERQADLHAATILARAGADPAALADVLSRISRDLPPGLAFLATHPGTAERAAAIRGFIPRTESAPRPGADRPLLSPSDWAALKAYC